jgi:hypothetical protein
MKVGRFEVTRDTSGWTLRETHMGKKRDGSPREIYKDRFFANLEQCCYRIIDMSAADADSVQEVIDAIKTAEKNIIAAIVK